MTFNSYRSPFLRLPPEIRNRIYELVFGGHRLWIGYTPHRHEYTYINKERHQTHSGGGLYHRMYARDDKSKNRPHWKPGSLNLGLLRVCRQIYGEAALLPYTLNRFTFKNDWVRTRCTKTLQPTQKCAMDERPAWDKPRGKRKSLETTRRRFRASIEDVSYIFLPLCDRVPPSSSLPSGQSTTPA